MFKVMYNFVSALLLLTFILFPVITGCNPPSTPVPTPPVSPSPSSTTPIAAPPTPSVSPMSELNIPDKPLAEKRLRIELVYSGGEQTGLCYLGAYAMLAKFADSNIDFMNVIANSGMGASALYIPQANILFGGSFLGDIGQAAKNQGFDYYIASLKGAQLTDDFLCPDFPKNAKQVIYKDSQEEMLNLLKRLISNDIPAEVHLDLFFIKEPMTIHTTWAGQPLQFIGHIDHYMTVTGYDSKYIYLNDPIEKAAGKGKDIPVNTSDFLEAWKNGNHSSFDQGARVGPYWMLFLGKRGKAKGADELISWNKDFAAKASGEIRKAANNPNIMELLHCNEMYRAREDFGAFMKQYGHENSGSLFVEVARLFKGLCSSSNPKADLLKIADLQEQALKEW